MEEIIRRSPLFYVGDKNGIMKDIKKHFPKKVKRFIEPFTGGGTVFLNVNAKEYLLNDINPYVKSIHKLLIRYSKSQKRFFRDVKKIIDKYHLSRSYEQDVIPRELKEKYRKTYYAVYNRKGYLEMRKDYNDSKRKNPLMLYLLLIYGFNRMLRFNSKDEFNIPVGNVDFNDNTVKALNTYFGYVKGKDITLHSKDFAKFLDSIKLTKGDFVYLDPPYLISSSEYNKLWSEKKEKELLDFLEKLDKKKIKFAISNVVQYNEFKNEIFSKWMKKYNVYKIKSNYISYHNNKQKKIVEVLVTNYGKT